MKNDRDRERHVRRRPGLTRPKQTLAPVDASAHGILVICGRCESTIERCNCVVCHDAYYERGVVFPVVVSALPCMICRQEALMNGEIDNILHGPTAEEE